METSTDTGLKLITGPTGSYYYFEQEILERVQNMSGVDYDFIYLLPVKRAVRYFKEDLISRSGRRALIDPPVFTFYEFMTSLYRDVPRARKIISPAMKLFLVEETLKKSVGGLRFFNKSSATRRGLVQKVDGLLTELREYGYTREDLEEFLEETDHRIHDFALLIEKFEEILGDRLMDEAGAIQEVFNFLDEAFWKSRFPHVKMIYLNGYGLFTRPMYHFFERVRQFCGVKIKLDYVENHERIFGHVTPAFHMLQGLNPVVVEDAAPGPLEKILFQNNRDDIPQVDLERNILIQPATNRAEEVAFLANYVKRLHHGCDIPLEKIGITFPSLERYAPLIHEIFPKYGIPYNISTGFQLSQSPLIRSFLLLLEVPLLGYDVKKMIQLISSPFFKPPGSDELDEGGVKNIAQLLRLTHFHGKWEDALKRQLQYLKDALEKTAEDGFDRRHIEELIALLEGGVKPLRQLLDDLKNLDKRLTVSDFRERFLGLLEKYGFLDWYRVANPHISPREIEQEYRAFNRFVKLLDQFSWVITNLPGKQKLTLSDFHQYLSLLVSHATYNLREWANHGLQIMPRLEILSIEPEVLIFGGMVEGDFPRPFTQDVFFHDEEREKLGLIATEDLLGQDRYMFYQILSSQVGRLVLTYPRFENESARVPSNLLNILADQFKVRWRRQVPSEYFLRHPQKLVERVSAQIPPGIGAAEEIQLHQWKHLQQDNPAALDALGLWTERVRINYDKRRPGEFGIYEGVLSAYPQLVEEIKAHFSERPYSITRLESFAFCPIQFYMRYLIGLRPDEEMETGLTALERGQLVHSTLFRFYSQLQQEKRLDRPWEARDVLMAIAGEEFERLPFRGLLFDLEKERYLGHAGFSGIWDAFLKAEEAGIEESGFTPAYFEMAFGKAGGANEQDAASIEEPITLERDGKHVQIVGKIDRIDTNAAGQAMLLDYKTGSKGWRAAEVLAGLTLQLPLYARIIERLAETGNDLQLSPVATAIFQVKSVDECKRMPLIYDGEAGLSMPRLPRNASLPNKDLMSADGEPISYQDMLERVEAYIFHYVNSIESAQFRHTRFPMDAACDSYCEFRRMCRKDVRKLSG